MLDGPRAGCYHRRRRYCEGLENYGLEYTTTSFTGMMSAMGPIA